MKKIISVVLTSVLFCSSFSYAIERKVASAQDDDGMWWDCSAQMRGGDCIRDTLSNLKLKKDEQEFIKNVLDKVPARNVKKEDVYKVFGKKPDSEIGININYQNLDNGQGDVIVSIMSNKLTRILWMKNNRFFMVKST